MAAVFRPPSPLPRHPDLPDPETGTTGTQTTAGATATTAGQTAGTTGRGAAVAEGMETPEPVEAVTAEETIMEALTIAAAKGTKAQGEGEGDQTGTTGEGEAKGHTTTGSQAAVAWVEVVPGQDQAWAEEAATGIAVVGAAPAAGEGPVGPPGHPSLPFSAVGVLPCPLGAVVGEGATTCLGERVVASSSTSRTATKTTDTTHTIASPLGARNATDHPDKKILLWFFPPLKCKNRCFLYIELFNTLISPLYNLRSYPHQSFLL